VSRTQLLLEMPFMQGMVSVYHALPGWRTRRQHLSLVAPYFSYPVVMSLFGVGRWTVFSARLHAKQHGAERPVPPSRVSYRISPGGAGPGVQAGSQVRTATSQASSSQEASAKEVICTLHDGMNRVCVCVYCCTRFVYCALVWGLLAHSPLFGRFLVLKMQNFLRGALPRTPLGLPAASPRPQAGALPQTPS